MTGSLAGRRTPLPTSWPTPLLTHIPAEARERATLTLIDTYGTTAAGVSDDDVPSDAREPASLVGVGPQRGGRPARRAHRPADGSSAQRGCRPHA